MLGEFVIAVYRGDKPIDIANPDDTSKRLRMKKGDVTIQSIGVAHFLKSIGFECQQVSWEKIWELLKERKAGSENSRDCPESLRKFANLIGTPSKLSDSMINSISFVSVSSPKIKRLMTTLSRHLGLPFFDFDSSIRSLCPVLCGGWSDEYLKLQAPEIWCFLPFSLLQLEIKGKIQLLNKIRDLSLNGKIKRVFLLDRAIAESFRSFGIKTELLPVIFDIPTSEVQPPWEKTAGIFSAWGPEKNLAIQAIAAALLGFEIHLSDLDEVSEIEELVRPLNAKIRSHPPLSEEDFSSLIGKMQIGLQASIADPMGFTSAEMLLRGVPVVSSFGISAKLLDSALREKLNVPDPTSVESLMRVIGRAAEIGLSLEARRDLAKAARSRAERFNAEAVKLWKNSLNLS